MNTDSRICHTLRRLLLVAAAFTAVASSAEDNNDLTNVPPKCDPGKTCYVINASGRSGLVLELERKPSAAEYFDTMGNSVKGIVPEAGISRVSIPASGLLKLQF